MPATLSTHAPSNWSPAAAHAAPPSGTRRALGWLLGAVALLLLVLFYGVVSDAVERADMRRVQQRADLERHARCAALPPASRELCMLTAAAPVEGSREAPEHGDGALLSVRVQ